MSQIILSMLEIGLFSSLKFMLWVKTQTVDRNTSLVLVRLGDLYCMPFPISQPIMSSHLSIIIV